jgi:hypothetical protein
MKREKGRLHRKRWKESGKEEYVQRESRVGRQMRRERREEVQWNCEKG